MLFEFQYNFKSLFLSCNFNWVRREANGVAHSMTKHVFCCSNSSIPIPVLEAWRLDSLSCLWLIKVSVLAKKNSDDGSIPSYVSQIRVISFSTWASIFETKTGITWFQWIHMYRCFQILGNFNSTIGSNTLNFKTCESNICNCFLSLGYWFLQLQ